MKCAASRLSVGHKGGRSAKQPLVSGSEAMFLPDVWLRATYAPFPKWDPTGTPKWSPIFLSSVAVYQHNQRVKKAPDPRRWKTAGCRAVSDYVRNEEIASSSLVTSTQSKGQLPAKRSRQSDLRQDIAWGDTSEAAIPLHPRSLPSSSGS